MKKITIEGGGGAQGSSLQMGKYLFIYFSTYLFQVSLLQGRVLVRELSCE